MRKLLSIKHYIALSLCLFSLYSCVNQLEKDEETIEQGTIPINISTRVQSSKTRVTNTSFDVNDAIGLYVLAQPSSIQESRYIDNMRFTYKPSQIFEPDELIFFPEGNKTCDFISYFPYSEKGVQDGETFIDVSVESDQTEIKAYSNSKFMVAETKKVTATEETIDLIFKHKFTRLNIEINPEANYSIEDLLNLNPTIKIKNTNTKAVYDILNNEIKKQNTNADIKPNGSWSIKDNKLVGKSAIVIPQTLIAPYTLIELIIDGKTFESKINEDLILKGGYIEDITITFIASSQLTEISINPSIEGWGEANKNEIDAEEVSSSSLHIPSLSFTKSNVYKIISNGKQVAEICKEYLLNETINDQAIVVYPVKNGETDLTRGIVCQLINESQNKHGGIIAWDKLNNTFIYEEGNSSPIEYISIAENYEISISKIESALQIHHLPYTITDIRGNETNTYPIVKIGTQYWMRNNLKATKYTDGTDITKGNDFNTVTPKYCQPNAFYYFYNSAAIAHNSLSPSNWRIGNESDWLKLKTYINENASLLKGGTLWEERATNLTGFNGIATGLYNGTHVYQDKNKNWFAFYWCTKDSSPELTCYSVYLSSHNDFINTGSNNDVLGACIRCIKE